MKEHKSVSIADQIFEQLELDILSGKYPRGETLSELKLSEELGVSRTPIREALRRLEQERFVEESGRSLRVVGISKEDMLDMYEVRTRLEGEAARRAALQISDEALADMRETLELQRLFVSQTEGDYTDRIKDLDSRFHEQLYRACGSAVYSDLLCAMHKRMTKFRRASVSKRSRAAQSMAEHEAIYEALCRRDPEAAAAAALAHVAGAKSRLLGMEM